MREIKNKLARRKLISKKKEADNIKKLQAHKDRKDLELEHPELKQERLAKNVPKTLDNTMEYQEDIVDMDDDEVIEDEKTDEFALFFQGKRDPKICITTSLKPSKKLMDFVGELTSIFPTSESSNRQDSTITEFIEERKKDYTHVMIVHEDKKQDGPNSIMLFHLPNGPTAFYKLSSIIPSVKINGHGRPSAHFPEIILNNFKTRLGHTVGRFFASMFPPVPEFQGRQVVTLHNQRDYIFIRRHRYMFRNKQKVDLQEIGPRFTLKLRWLQNGIYSTQFGEFEFMYRSALSTSRKKYFL